MPIAIAQDGTGEIVLGLSCEDAQDKDDWRLMPGFINSD